MIYIFLGFLLLPLYFFEFLSPSKIRFSLGVVFFSFIYFMVFAGLRDDTGYDWYVYKGIYEVVQSSSDFGSAIILSNDSGSEFGFSLLVYCLSSVGLGFWSIQFLACTFNMFVFLQLNRVVGGGGIKGLFIYYCWLFMVLQMGVLRMSVAVSLLTLCMIAIFENKKTFQALYVFLAITFHMFSIALGVIVLVSKINFPRFFLLLIILLLFLFYLSGFDMAGSAIYFFSGISPEFISKKLDIYMEVGALYQRGLGETIYKTFFLGVFMFFYVFVDLKSFVERYVFNLTSIYLIIMLVFWKYPIFHDRVKYLVMMPAFYLALSVVTRFPIISRMSMAFCMCFLSLCVLLYQVEGELFYPYDPYFNIFERLLGFNGNDGQERAIDYYLQFNSLYFEGK